MTTRINRLTVPYPEDRRYDLNGDGLVNISDKSIMNTLINRLPLL
jgi:hypothetical protein